MIVCDTNNRECMKRDSTVSVALHQILVLGHQHTKHMQLFQILQHMEV